MSANPEDIAAVEMTNQADRTDVVRGRLEGLVTGYHGKWLHAHVDFGRVKPTHSLLPHKDGKVGEFEKMDPTTLRMAAESMMRELRGRAVSRAAAVRVIEISVAISRLFEEEGRDHEE